MAFTNSDREKLTDLHTIVKEKLMPASEDYETRLRLIEKAHLKLLGGAAVVSGAIGFLFPWISSR